MVLKGFDLNKIPLSGHNLIEASAGTGKTYTISRLFLRLLLEKELSPSSILVVTFTEAATQELKERVYFLLKEAVNVFLQKTSKDPFFLSLLSTIDNKKGIELLLSAIHNFDTVSIYTIHGFCQRVLFEHSFESGVTYNSSVISDQSTITKEITNDFWRLNFYESSAQFASYALHTGLTHERFSDLLRLSGRTTTNLNMIPQIKDVNYGNSESVFNEKLETVKKIWFEEKNEISNLLYSKSLKAVKYKKEIVQEIISDMDLLAASTIEDPLLFNRFENLTTSVIQANTKKNCITPEHVFFDKCEELQKCAQELKEKYDDCIINLKIKYIKYVYQELRVRKEKKNQLYFDDLLLRVHDALKGDSEKCKLTQVLGKVYKAALIDEFQDTDSIQYKIFSTLFSNSTMFLIGDPKQSIYSFRGADIFTYLEASKRVNSKYTLYTNYRCSKRLLEAINTLFGRHERMFVFDGISFFKSKSADLVDRQSVKMKYTSEKPFNFLFIDTEKQKPNIKDIRLDICSVVTSYVLNLIKNDGDLRLNDGLDRLYPQDIAILVRTNSEAEMIKATLSEAGVHSIIDSGCSVFESNEATHFMRVLKAVCDPCNDEAIRCALTTDLFGYNANRIEFMSLGNNESEQITELFFRLHDLWNGSGFQVMIRFLFNKLKIRSKILSLSQGERKLTNYLHLSELVHVEEQCNNSGMSALFNWINDKIYGDSAYVPDEEVMRLESDENAVKIVTIHKSKGLEYSVVFCPFCWHRSDTGNRKNEPIVFHYENKDSDPVLALGSDEIESNRILAEKEILAENMRLLYVALTRAKLGCYVVYGKFPGSESSSLSYLLFGDELENVSVQNLKNHVKPFSSEQILNRLQLLEHKCDSICVKRITNNEINISNYKENVTPEKLQYRKFKGSIPDTWRISSFSSLTRSHHYSEIPDYDYHVYPENKNEKTDFENIMDFPKGSVAGTFLHHIFEQIKFSDISLTAPDIISESLPLYGFDAKWFNTILKLIKDVTETHLDKELKLKLSRLAPSNCLKEVQFNFPLKKFVINDLNKIFNNNNQLNLFETDYSISELDFSITKGYMKGFIDLIFEWENKFFLLDWKSNYLGPSKDDYGNEKLFKVMKKERYILQSYIYLIAVDKFLKLRYPSYNYEDNFGGIYYLFLRGINPDSKSGIYFFRPEKKILIQLKLILSN